MSNLKTLKDINKRNNKFLVFLFERYKDGEETIDGIIRYLDGLNREEAIKWIKHYEKTSDKYFDGKADSLKEFFNLEEEDLKDD